MAVTFRVGAAVADEFVAARLEGVDDTGRVIEHGRVDEMSGRQIELVEQVETAPDADPVAVVPPREGPRIRCRACDGQEMAFAGAEGEMFDVEAEIDGQPLSVRPGVVRPVDD